MQCDTWLAMQCDTWLAMCHPHGSPCVAHMARHVSPYLPRNTLNFDYLGIQRNSTRKLDFARRFQLCNPFCHPRSKKISTFFRTIPINYRFAPFFFLFLFFEKFKFKIFTGFTHPNSALANNFFYFPFLTLNFFYYNFILLF